MVRICSHKENFGRLCIEEACPIWKKLDYIANHISCVELQFINKEAYIQNLNRKVESQ